MVCLIDTAHRVNVKGFFECDDFKNFKNFPKCEVLRGRRESEREDVTVDHEGD